MNTQELTRRTGAALLLVALVIFAGASLWALAAPGVQYAWPLTMISDLGARGCFTADGRWICSPRAAAFNAGLLGSGLSLVGAATALRAARHPAPRGAVLSAGLGLVLLGLSPSDTAHGLHMAGAVLALPVASALLVVSAVCEVRRADLPRTGSRSPGAVAAPAVRGALGTVALVCTSAHLLPQARFHGAAEMVSLVALFLALLLEACTLLRAAPAPRRCDGSAAEMTQARPHRRPAAPRTGAADHR
ncbi:hypothetical protein BRM3_10330 [Brachybacterium huguangmaarense]|uniref:DUF998 domain-containing protein n=1 Tax=Brachybacterium huguangmaarense TaxID=1652028 RepID=A0ABY6FYM0_9MICO|nr:hypothetical protein [Brachybacterium huguangmaarense]UYG16028.1 hypothetical protein BRM3_10330 [Brachybacterium huguangmaarense]